MSDETNTVENISVPPPEPPSDMAQYIAWRREGTTEREEVRQEEKEAREADRRSEESPQQKYMSARREQIESAKGDRNEPWTPAMQAAFDRRVQRKLAQIEKEKGESRESQPAVEAPRQPAEQPQRRQAEPQQPSREEIERQVRQQDHIARHESAMESALASDPDKSLRAKFEKVVVSEHLGAALKEAILPRPNSHEITLYLVKNPDFVSKLNRMTPNQAYDEILESQRPASVQ